VAKKHDTSLVVDNILPFRGGWLFYLSIGTWSNIVNQFLATKWMVVTWHIRLVELSLMEAISIGEMESISNFSEPSEGYHGLNFWEVFEKITLWDTNIAFAIRAPCSRSS